MTFDFRKSLMDACANETATTLGASDLGLWRGMACAEVQTLAPTHNRAAAAT